MLSGPKFLAKGESCQDIGSLHGDLLTPQPRGSCRNYLERLLQCRGWAHPRVADASRSCISNRFAGAASPRSQFKDQFLSLTDPKSLQAVAGLISHLQEAFQHAVSLGTHRWCFYHYLLRTEQMLTQAEWPT